MNDELQQEFEAAGRDMARQAIGQVWQGYESEMQSAVQHRMRHLPKSLVLTPYEVDMRQPETLTLKHCKLLNHNPSEYFGCELPWPPPANSSIPAFLTHVGLGEYAKVVDRLRCLTDGTIYVRGVNQLWVKVWGVVLDFRNLDRPLTQVGAEVRFANNEITEELSYFLGML